MDGCVLLTSTPSCVVSSRGETTHSGVDVNNTHPSMINPLNKPQRDLLQPGQWRIKWQSQKIKWIIPPENNTTQIWKTAWKS